MVKFQKGFLCVREFPLRAKIAVNILLGNMRKVDLAYDALLERLDPETDFVVDAGAIDD